MPTRRDLNCRPQTFEVWYSLKTMKRVRNICALPVGLGIWSKALHLVIPSPAPVLVSLPFFQRSFQCDLSWISPHPISFFFLSLVETRLGQLVLLVGIIYLTCTYARMCANVRMYPHKCSSVIHLHARTCISITRYLYTVMIIICVYMQFSCRRQSSMPDACLPSKLFQWAHEKILTARFLERVLLDTCTHTYTNKHTHTHACTSVHTHTHTRTHTRARVQAHEHASFASAVC